MAQAEQEALYLAWQAAPGGGYGVAELAPDDFCVDCGEPFDYCVCVHVRYPDEGTPPSQW